MPTSRLSFGRGPPPCWYFSIRDQVAISKRVGSVESKV
jgi:hypothetical protein